MSYVPSNVCRPNGLQRSTFGALVYNNAHDLTIVGLPALNDTSMIPTPLRAPAFGGKRSQIMLGMTRGVRDAMGPAGRSGESVPPSANRTLSCDEMHSQRLAPWVWGRAHKVRASTGGASGSGTRSSPAVRQAGSAAGKGGAAAGQRAASGRPSAAHSELALPRPDTRRHLRCNFSTSQQRNSATRLARAR